MKKMKNLFLCLEWNRCWTHWRLVFTFEVFALVGPPGKILVDI